MSVTPRAKPEDFGIGRFFFTMRDAVIVADARSQQIILWNPAAEQILGYSPEESVGMRVEELVPPELRDLHRKGIARYSEAGRGDLVDAHEPVELQALHKDGHRVDIELVFAPLTDAPFDGVFIAAFIRDVSRRTELKHEAERALANMRLILESTGEGIYGIDMAGDCTFINFAAEEMIGYRGEEAVGRNMHDLIHHSKPDGSPYPVEQCPIFRSFRLGRGCRVDDEVMWRRDGTPVPVQYSAFPIIDEGSVVGAVVSMSDVTQRRMLEDALRQANARSREAYEKEKDAVAQLKSVDQLKNEFVAMVAHDLKSPMTVIGGLADTMSSRWDRLSEERRMEFLGLISSNVRKLADLVDDVLQVARIEANEISYVIEPFDLAQLVERTVEEQRQADPERRIEVSKMEVLPPALADEQRVWQVLTNLLSNALKFSPADAPVEVSVQHDDDDALRIAVTDHGGGIRPEEMDKLFQKFSRLSQHGGGAAKGTGLGLFICKRMVEEQGGQIWAESALGTGSTFTFTLPTAPPA
jgi:PAS domain S-box-containing protein